MEFSRNLVVFDVDGTLNKTELYAIEAFRKTLDELDLVNITDEQIISRFGATIEDDIAYFFKTPSKYLEKKYKEILSKHWNALMLKKAACYPKTKEVLLYLKAKGYILAICSNASTDEINITLEKLGIIGFFDFIQGSQNGSTKIENLRTVMRKVKADKTYMVGDRYYDYEAAKENEAIFIGCLYGYGSYDELEDANYKIASISDITEIL